MSFDGQTKHDPLQAANSMHLHETGMPAEAWPIAGKWCSKQCSLPTCLDNQGRALSIWLLLHAALLMLSRSEQPQLGCPASLLELPQVLLNIRTDPEAIFLSSGTSRHFEVPFARTW